MDEFGGGGGVDRKVDEMMRKRRKRALTLGVGIPTRNRPGYLALLLTALLNQTRRPERVCIVNDSSEKLEYHPLLGGLFGCLEAAGIGVAIVEGARRGAPQAHQLALETLQTDLIFRCDDDLLPAGPDFLERLAGVLEGDLGVAAAGGVYPEVFRPVTLEYRQVANEPGFTNKLADLLEGFHQLQFSRYSDAPRLVEAEHLYSSWVYRREAMLAVGGFPLCYSPLGHREETDASVRLRLLGGWRLVVDTGALAWHWRALTGGCRELEQEGLREEDDELFRVRLAKWRDPRRV
jgi:GT2 family glycosyltransferase